MAEGKCRKCGRPYKRLGEYFEKHEAACDGTPWKGRQPRGPRRREHPERIPSPDTGITGLDAAVADLNNRRLELLRHKELLRTHIGLIDEEVKILDGAVDTIKKAKRE